MRVFVADSGYVVAADGRFSVAIPRASLPADVSQARAQLQAMLDAARGGLEEITRTPDPTLDEQATDKPDFDAFIVILTDEIAFLDTNIPLIDSMTTVAQLRVAVKRLALESRAMMKAMRYVALRVAE